jgi:hypothetical protein
MVVQITFVYFCPRCDRKIESDISTAEVEKKTRTHVSEAHPDYDPEWWDTYPEAFGN